VAVPDPNADVTLRIPKTYASPMPAAVLLAHESGWDEILMVAGPVVVFAGLLVIARRRAVAQAAKRD
jgi:hypothetical protein